MWVSVLLRSYRYAFRHKYHCSDLFIEAVFVEALRNLLAILFEIRTLARVLSFLIMRTVEAR